MPLLNYTSNVDVDKTAQEIARILSSHGAQAVLTEYDDKSTYLIGSNFQEWFEGMEVKIPKKLELYGRTLEKDMLDEEILKEWRPSKMTLGELAYALKNEVGLLKNGYGNIFYIKDKDDTLRAVRAYWSAGSGGWFVSARSVTLSYGWGAGDQVVSRNLTSAKPKDSLESRLKALEDFKEKVEKIIKL